MVMDFSASSLLSGMLVGSIGTGLFIYGKKAERYMHLAVGIALCIIPILITNPWALWGTTLAILAGLYAIRNSI